MLLCASTVWTQAQIVEPTTPPEPPKFDAQAVPNFVGVKDMFEFKALPEYHQPPFMDAMVEAGTIPPVVERLTVCAGVDFARKAAA